MLQKLWRAVIRSPGDEEAAARRIERERVESEKKRREAERRERLLREELARIRAVWKQVKG